MSDEEILANTRTWVEKAVIGLNLCPFAKAVYVKNQVRLVVSHARHTDAFLDDLDRELLLLVNTPPEQIETTLLIHPTLFPQFETFNDFLDVVDDVLIEHDLEGVIQVAPFHPDFQFEGTAPDDVGNCTNRSPFPILHLLREDSVTQAVTAGEEVARIVERNQRCLRDLGASGWRALW